MNNQTNETKTICLSFVEAWIAGQFVSPSAKVIPRSEIERFLKETTP